MLQTITRWPGDKKTRGIGYRDVRSLVEGKAPPYSPMTTSLKPGTPDLLGISWSQYGGKTGIWRFIRILAEHDIKATFVECPGRRSLREAVGALHRPAMKSPAIHTLRIWCFLIFLLRKKKK